MVSGRRIFWEILFSSSSMIFGRQRREFSFFALFRGRGRGGQNDVHVERTCCVFYVKIFWFLLTARTLALVCQMRAPNA